MNTSEPDCARLLQIGPNQSQPDTVYRRKTLNFFEINDDIRSKFVRDIKHGLGEKLIIGPPVTRPHLEDGQIVLAVFDS